MRIIIQTKGKAQKDGFALRNYQLILFQFFEFTQTLKRSLLDTGKVMISFRVPKNELEQNLCKGLLNSRGTKLDIKINHLPMCANVDTCSFAILKGSSLFSDFSITVENNLILREDSI